jgi:hypothetical protein
MRSVTASSRRNVLRTASVAGAAAVVAGVVAFGPTACSSAHTSDHGQASCVAPFIRADPTRSPPDPGHPTTFGHVKPGQRISIHGWWYYGGQCGDAQASGQPATGQPASTGSVQLSLTTADRQTATLATVDPGGDDASFVATVDVPVNAAAGPATITDGRGHMIDLVIVTN